MSDADRPTIVYRPGGLDDPERTACYQRLQLACAGTVVGTAMAAQVDSLAALIAFAATDRANAAQIIASLAGDLQRAVDDNWDSVKEQAAFAIPTGGRA